MIPSKSNGNNDPFPYIDHSIPDTHFANEITPYSKHEDLPLSFFHFPSPYEIEIEDHDVFFHQHHDYLLLHQQTLTTDNSVSDTIINMPDFSKNDESTIDCSKKSNNNATDDQQILRKRTSSKRDWHSKINTAKGPRDRRMRLSLDVARDFFGLHDMLGYDKASKTIEWLLIQAKPEIKKLGRSVAAANSPSSTSTGEVVSGIDKAAIEVSSSRGKPSTKEKKVRQPRKTSFRPLARNLREKARTRAKARKNAKIMWTQRFYESKLSYETRNNYLNKFGSWSPFEPGGESRIQDPNAVAEVKEFSSRDDELIRIIQGVMIDEPSEIMNWWSPNSMFSCLRNAGTNQEHQLTGFASGLKQ